MLRGDGLEIPDLLRGILPLFELDAYADPLIMMSAVEGDTLDPQVEADYLAAIRTVVPEAPAPCGLIGLLFMIVRKKPFRV